MENDYMILLKGEPKTQEIALIQKEKKGAYSVQFKQSYKLFHYSQTNVLELKSCKELDPDDYKISNTQRQLYAPTHIWVFNHLQKKFYRLEFSNGAICEFKESELIIKHSALSSPKAKNTFNYLKKISGIQTIGTVHGSISLQDKYNRIDFIDDDTALACYLNPQNLHTLQGLDHLLFPFYSNLSQMQAVEDAFKSQISIIQGPPGTGKTQTILNIIANIVAQLVG